MNTPLLAPSILSADFTRLGADVQACQQAGADWIHVDVMDGRFVPNLTFGAPIVEACRRVTSLPLDVHLMVQTPEPLLEDFARAGASSLTVHYETCPHLHRTLQQIHALGLKAGVAINPSTSALLLEDILPYADLLLVMTVNPGFGGQKFIDLTPKIRALRSRLDALSLPARLQVDGGVSAETLPRLLQAGADTFVAGNAVFRHPQGIAGGLLALKQKITT